MAQRLGRLLALPYDEFGKPSVFRIPLTRSFLAQAVRDAADGCETIGVEHNDTRWTGIVALITNAAVGVHQLQSAEQCFRIAELMTRMRTTVAKLRDRATSQAVTVRLS
jgi:hypothetical protein